MSKYGRGRRLLRLLLTVTATVLVLTGAYLGYVVVRHNQSIDLPAPDGPYAVGRLLPGRAAAQSAVSGVSSA